VINISDSGSYNRSNTVKKKNPLHQLGIKPQFIGRPARSPIFLVPSDAGYISLGTVPTVEFLGSRI